MSKPRTRAVKKTAQDQFGPVLDLVTALKELGVAAFVCESFQVQFPSFDKSGADMRRVGFQVEVDDSDDDDE